MPMSNQNLQEFKLGKYQRNMLTFIRKCNGWHSLANDSFTQKVAKSLEKRNPIEIESKLNMFRAK